MQPFSFNLDQVSELTPRTVSALFPTPPFVLVTQAGNGNDEPPLQPSERLAIEGMTAARRTEFARGRACARRAICLLGGPTTAILRDERGCPVWPKGFCGSISHTEEYVAGVVASTQHARALGLDIEKRTDFVEARHYRLFCHVEELSWLLAQPPAHARLYALALFSIKESLYKCIYSATGAHLVFGEIRVVPNLVTGVFHATLPHIDTFGMPRSISGRVGFNEHYVFSGVWLAAE